MYHDFWKENFTTSMVFCHECNRSVFPSPCGMFGSGGLVCRYMITEMCRYLDMIDVPSFGLQMIGSRLRTVWCHRGQRFIHLPPIPTCHTCFHL